MQRTTGLGHYFRFYPSKIALIATLDEGEKCAEGGHSIVRNLAHPAATVPEWRADL